MFFFFSRAIRVHFNHITKVVQDTYAYTRRLWKPSCLHTFTQRTLKETNLTKRSLESFVQQPSFPARLPSRRSNHRKKGRRRTSNPQSRRGPLAVLQLCGPQERLASSRAYIFVAHRPGPNPEVVAGMKIYGLRSTPSRERHRSSSQQPYLV
jgi:hypothetical protein